VHISGPNRPRAWPEWVASTGIEHPLEIIEETHDAIDSLIDRALADGEDDRDARIDDVVVAVRTHVDVTRRVLFPMVRRVGDEVGERLADAAEAQERALLDLVAGIDATNPRQALQDIGVAMHDHAAVGDDILALLRTQLDPVERESLADGLAAAQATSTVSRLYRNASKAQVPAPTEHPEQQDDGHALDHQAAESTQVVEVAPLVVPTPIGNRAIPIELPDPTPVRQKPRTTSALSRLLVGVDGSVAAAAALRWAGRLAGHVGAEVLVANVFEPEQAEVSPDEYQKLLTGAEDRLAEWADPLSDSDLHHQCLQLTGPPDTLLAAARSEHADLLVVGTRGAGRHAALHLGSMAHHLAHHTGGPLAIVPLDGADADIGRIVLGVDGSEGSAAAVSWCAAVAPALGAEVFAVCALEPRARRTFKGDGRWRDAAEAAISSEWVAPLRTAGIAVRTRVVDDAHPLAALADAAAEENADLLIVGTRGLSEIGGVRLGRLPLQLVHHTRVPVVLVPPAEHG
jgi:nucleotide-binding universal stress UspA family protein